MASWGSARRVLRAAVAGSLWTATAQTVPTTLLQVSGSRDAVQSVDFDEVVAVGFTLGQTYTNVSISADISCAGCEAQVILMRGDLGPTANAYSQSIPPRGTRTP